jgi:hypothetical protein
MDVVYNHSSPDAVLTKEHPEWYWKGPDGKPGPRIADWSDVADFDYSHKELWDYQIESLEKWARFGADGFRCDVASLVPVAFWAEARRRLAAVKPILWLAESVHKEFVTECRRRGLYAASDPELHAAFDLSYDYDGREELEAAWRGERSLAGYLKHVEVPGAYLAYMGEDLAMERRIGLFDSEPILPGEGDPSFRSFFAEALSLTKRIKTEAPLFDARLLGEGVVLVQRHGRAKSYTALLNVDGRSGTVKLPKGLKLEGQPLMGEMVETNDGSCVLGRAPLILAG